MKLIVTVKGVDAVSLKVKRWVEFARAGLKLGTSEAGFIFETEAKALVPVATGMLRDSIHTEVIEDQPTRQLLAVTPVVEAANPYGITPAYARRIEFGFMGTDSLGRTYHQPAQPYMRAAYEARKADAEEAIRNGVLENLQGAR